LTVRTLTLALVAVLGVPLVAGMPGAHVTLPTSDAAMLGLALEAGPVSANPVLLAAPGASVANPLAGIGMGPERLDTAALAASMRTSSDGTALAAFEAGVLVPLPLLPDGAVYVGAGTFRSADGFGARFAESVVVLDRATPALALGAARATAAAPPALAHGDDGAAPAPVLPHDAAPTLGHDGAAAPRPSPAPGETSTQTAAPLERVTVSAATAAVAAGVGLGLLALLGIALYHRIRPHATLDNGTRKTIFETVCANPGAGVQEVAATARVSYSTATYHLDRLVAAGMLVMTPDGNKLCYYKNGGSFTEAERRILPILKNTEAARVLEAIVREPGTYRSALANVLGVTTTTINWHLKRLREAGLVSEDRQGRSAYLYPTSEGQSSLAALATKLGDADADALDVARRCSVGAMPAAGAS
jgi:predicted transcriptional regulator